MRSIDSVFQYPPQRVVSLVPSMTESLFDLGLGARLVGITDYCIYPEAGLKGLPRVGGPKDFRIEEIVHLSPELVIANQEENAEELIRQLMVRDIPVWITFPHSVNEAMADLVKLAGMFRSDQAQKTVRVLEQGIEYLRMATEGAKSRYFCPIWHEREASSEWWMTINGDTYSSDVLSILGGENIFSGRERRYPLAADLGRVAAESAGTRDVRYPRVTIEEIASRKPDFLVFTDEPFLFSELEQHRLRDQLSARMSFTPNCVYVDGSLIHWPGTRISKALEVLSGLFD